MREIKDLLKSILATLEGLEDKYLVEQMKESDEEINRGNTRDSYDFEIYGLSTYNFSNAPK